MQIGYMACDALLMGLITLCKFDFLPNFAGFNFPLSVSPNFLSSSDSSIQILRPLLGQPKGCADLALTPTGDIEGRERET